MKHLMEVEKSREGINGEPSVGPAYRSVFAKDGFPSLKPGLESCWDIFRVSVEENPKNQMLGRHENIDGKAGEYVWQTYAEVYDIVIKVGASIRSSGVAKGGRCGIYGANCPEWVISMEACNAHGIYCVPLYDTLGSHAVEFIIKHAEIQIVIVEEKKIGELLNTLPNTTSTFIKTIVSFGNVTHEQKEEVEKYGLSIYPWDEFLLLGNGQQYELPIKTKTDICTIMYTSGTTGDPKGVMMSNESILSIIAGVDLHLQCIHEKMNSSDVYMSYLPLAHIFDRVMEELFIYNGSSIGFWRGDVKLLFEDIKVLKPTFFCAVPRVLDRIYSGMQEKISSSGFIKKTLFNLAFAYKFRNMKKGYKHEEASPFFDKLVFSKVKEGMGGNIRVILSGAAPLAPHVESFLRVIMCCQVLQGYGLTETCAGSFVNQPNDLAMLGTVGPPVPNIDVRLDSVPEMGYDALSSVPRGEICIRGKTLFTGYHKREDLTKEALIDGWFHTGDIGEWQADGSLKMIDRRKNIFKLSQGEYVAVENLENIYGFAPTVDMIWIYGNSFKSYLVAVVNPNQQAIENWAEQNGVTGDFSAICSNSRAKEFILSELAKVAKTNKLKGFEYIKMVHLDPLPFDMERDLLTPTFKKKRPQLLKYYQIIIDGLYESTK
ncbi:hypothetical protein LUZ60_010095 [Juncus effusus]|nr:hypothetical protein LUZ60_010095 [Juncus effusus]